MSNNQIVTTDQTNSAMTLSDKAREIAGRVKYMIQNGRTLTDPEVFALAQFSAANDLNPFAGEAYYLPGKGPCPGIAGWRKKAQESLNWEVDNARIKEPCHFWCETRPATDDEIHHDPKKGDIAIHVTLRDSLTNSRWRHDYFETMRELKSIGETDYREFAREMVGPEPVWTGVAVVYGDENFGGDKMAREERAAKRAEKIALRKRFPRVNLPEPKGGDVEYYDTEFRASEPLPALPKRDNADMLSELGYAPEEKHAPIAPIPAAPVVTDEWPTDFIQEMVIAYKASHANQIKNALKGATITPADGIDLGREWMRIYKANRESGMTTTEATAAANESIETLK